MLTCRKRGASVRPGGDRRPGFKAEAAELHVGEKECICFGGAQCLTLNVTENEGN